MDGLLTLAINNLSSPLILSFVLGLGAALARSDLTFPEAAAKALSIYLLFAIGFKGGVSVADHGVDLNLGAAILMGVILSAALPFVAFTLLKALTRLDRTNAAAVAGHYGSISIVTFVAGTSVLEGQDIPFEGYMVAVAAAMEAPAILSALWLLSARGGKKRMDGHLWREILLNGSIVLLVGAFAIGMMTGKDGLAEIESFIVSPFKGALCLFLLDMGLVAGRGIRQSRGVITLRLLLFGVLMPPIGASFGAGAALLLGLSTGGALLLMVLAASASYIAVPAAMRVAVPEADAGIYLTLSLGVTFPFNLTLGLPLYLAVAQAITGG
ncbi:MAG: sodium-dependent bicarbonate transport family permease [Paracoccaceae bacterium]|nr:sodium-dependent bicarbonate transport family permease [Paracoccaceae bacterium]MDG1370959.1 sodium-dependent bicarbonate transport family permease [Paracoccaceae bacterium]